jgi:hypothetical protein
LGPGRCSAARYSSRPLVALTAHFPPLSSVPSQRGARNESAVLCYVFPSYLRSCLRTGHLVVGGIFDRVGAGIDGAGGNAGMFALL